MWISISRIMDTGTTLAACFLICWPSSLLLTSQSINHQEFFLTFYAFSFLLVLFMFYVALLFHKSVEDLCIFFIFKFYYYIYHPNYCGSCWSALQMLLWPFSVDIVETELKTEKIKTVRQENKTYRQPPLHGSMDEENGCLRVCPGSHRAGRLPTQPATGGQVSHR